SDMAVPRQVSQQVKRPLRSWWKQMYAQVFRTFLQNFQKRRVGRDVESCLVTMRQESHHHMQLMVSRRCALFRQAVQDIRAAALLPFTQFHCKISLQNSGRQVQCDEVVKIRAEKKQA